MNPADMIRGVDVASFNGQPAAWQASAGKIAWAGVKLTELSAAGPYVNPDAADDWAWLLERKLGRVAYLFAHPSMPVAATVSLFADRLAALGLRDDDGIMLDLEDTDGLPPAQVSAWATGVTGALSKKFGRPPILYTYLSFAWAGNCAGLGHLPLWISDPSSPMGEPRVPAPWTDWAIHQFSTSAPIDRDVAQFSTLAQFRHAFGKPQPPEEAVKIISSARLAGTQQIPADRKPVVLKWTGSPALGPGGEAVRLTVAEALVSGLNIDMPGAGNVRVAVQVTGSEPAAQDYRGDGGWVLHTALIKGAPGASASVTVTNFGATAATVTGGTWQLAR